MEIRKCPQSGFTLIELLVVIGIIALLAAIIFPVFSSVRAKSRQTVCLSSLRQLGQAVFLYAQDYDDRFPYGGDPSDTETNSWIGWRGGRYDEKIRGLRSLPEVMAAQVKDRTLWRCPADNGYDRTGSFEDIPLAAHPSAFAAFGMSYAYMTMLPLDEQTLGNVRAWSRRTPYNEHEPAQVPLIADMAGRWHGGSRREDGRLNMVMIDGHAISVDRNKADKLWRIQFDMPSSEN